MIDCKYCGQSYEMFEHQKHENNCQKKPIECEYCKLLYFISDYDEHVYQCGNRTKRCEICQKYILLRGKFCLLMINKQDIKDHKKECVLA